MWKNNFEIVTCNYDIIAHVCIMPLSIKFLIYSTKMSEEGDKIEICFDLENCSTIAHITHIHPQREEVPHYGRLGEGDNFINHSSLRGKTYYIRLLSNSFLIS